MTKAVAATDNTTSYSLNLVSVMRKLESAVIGTGKSIPKITKKAKAKAWQGQVTAAMRAAFTEACEVLPKLIGKLVIEESRPFTAYDKKTLMAEKLAADTVLVPVTGRSEKITEMIHWGINEMLLAQGVPESEVAHTPGKLLVPELGKKFVREGGGRKPGYVDVELFREFADPDFVKQVIVTETTPELVIEAQVIERIDYERVLELLRNKPEDDPLFAALAKAFVQGPVNQVRINVRDMDEDDLEEDPDSQ